MAKNNEKENAGATKVDNTELVSLEAKAKGKKAVAEEQADAKEAAKSKKAKKVNTNKKTLKQKCKEIFSELKKVSWPSFTKVLKQTGIVIAVVLFFLVVIGVADVVLTWLYNLLV